MNLINQTPFAAQASVMPNQAGVDTLYLSVMASFAIERPCRILPSQPHFADADEYIDTPENSSLLSASNHHTGKTSTDIIVLGNAYAPNNQAVGQLDVRVTVGELTNALRVYGDRHWRNGRISRPAPFVSMPLRYENAYGGVCPASQQGAADSRNPVGKGYMSGRSIEAMDGNLLPNIEDPHNLIVDPADSPGPAGFGPIAPFWAPRLGYAGTYDQQWQRRRAPYLPLDFDPRFNNVAHPKMVYPGFLLGGETVGLTNMHKRGNLHFSLPGLALSSMLTMKANQTRRAQLTLETLVIKPNDLQLMMGWRAGFVLDKNLPEVASLSLWHERLGQSKITTTRHVDGSSSSREWALP